MEFEQAERAFQELEAQRRAGQLGEDAYRQRLNALRVTDEHGRLWMIQERTGHWYVWYNEQWQHSTPPHHLERPPQGSAPPAPQPIPTRPGAPPQATARPAAPRPAPTSPAARQRPVRAARRMGCAGVTLRLVLWMLAWVGVSVLVYYLAGRTILPYLGVGLVALVTLLLLLRGLPSGRAHAAAGAGR